ncbi:MAG: TldD/PmbA family protein, partial [Negativicutes bacterium]|nr:TldD/PmbA family protein [Negativicutes bacterium]
DLSPAHVGREAAAQALMLLGGRSVRTMKATLVLSPYVATNFLSVLAAAFSADAVQKGKSMLQDRLGQQVASSAVTVIDDGTLLNGIATAPFDGEGVLSARKELISGGKLLGFLHNSLTAARCGTVSTGNGVRNSFKSVTEVGPTNLFICAGDTAPQDIIRAVDNGFYVTAVMGLHMANPISGDFSLGAAGVWIENGELTHAVRGVAIAGNMLDLLGKVKAVGSDLTFFGSKGAPTLRIEEIMISGE